MEGTITLPARRPKRKQAAAKTARYGVLLLEQPDSGNPPKLVLRVLFEARGITSYHGMAKALGYSSQGMLHTACRGGLVSQTLLGAILDYFPGMTFEQLFTRGEEALRDAANLAA